MEKKNSVSKSPYEIFIPEDKRVIHARHSMRVMNLPRDGSVSVETSKRRATVHHIEEARAKKSETMASMGGDQLVRREQTVLDSEYIPAKEEVMTADKARELRKREEEHTEETTKDVFNARMRGADAEAISAILVERGIKPWTPEAEAFVKQWDVEQAEHAFAQLAQERGAAVMRANEANPKKHIELNDIQEKSIIEKFAKFGIDQQGLEQVAGFDTLSYGQRLLLAENLQQLTLGRVQEEAMQIYQNDTRQSKFLGRVWKGITKKYQIAKHEQTTAQAINTGGLAYHGELVKQLVEGTKRMGLDATLKDGSLEIQYIEAHPRMTEQEKERAREFNRVTTAYSKVPYEWSLATATPAQRNEYARVSGQFEKAKENILKIEQGIIGDKDALLFLSETENKIRLNQFFNTHPDAEKQLQSIESDSIWSKALANIATERGLYFGAGFVVRSVGAGILGAVGFPLAAVGMGGWMARRRAVATLRERDILARQGKKDMSSEARSVTTAHALSDKLDELVKKVNGEQDETKRQRYLSALQVRLEYTQNKLNAGLVDFGSTDRRIVNQYGLMDTLTTGSSTLLAQDAESMPVLGTKEERRRHLFSLKEKKISQARHDYLRKQMIYGAGLGIASFAAGYYAKDVLHAVAPSEAYAQNIPTGAEKHVMPARSAQTLVNTKEALTITPGVFHETVAIGDRGPEGAFIDALKKHPEIVARLGIKNIGKSAHTAWLEFAKEELKDPETQTLMSNLGYPKTADGYGEMMRHIEHGKIILEEQGGKLRMRIGEETEYLRAQSKAPTSVGPGGQQIEELPRPPVGQQIEDSVRPPTKIQIEEPAPSTATHPDQQIEDVVTQGERPVIAVETFVNNQFGLDGNEYKAIKDVPVKKLLEQIPSRDMAWKVWRGEVPGKEITLPHYGIYGAMEFKKHIDLAEYIRSVRPDTTVMNGDIDSFMRSGSQGRWMHSSETPVDEIQRAVSPANIPQEAVVSNEQRVMNLELERSGLTPEKYVLLKDDIYNSSVPVQKIMTQYKLGKITAEDFANYYSNRVAHAKPSTQMLENIKTTFSDASGQSPKRGGAQRALEIMVRRMQGIR